ncbi:MAG: TetM/TetW/TetO/TetS family tetracycline resistance ribosomal protection protein [Lachnospiraceae bacterium]|nr:TetM/TetW/TetO/TetS family tetracycline resistance ribosomal protection protein [Lachnospiraceae bacterium]
MPEEALKNNLVIGILAHVDAGKTTLSEQLLFKTGAISKAGRVDHRDTFLDTHSLERERGITIFSKQAIFSVENFKFTLLDTPGHADFGSEAERTLQVMDYAILVISGTDGVQSHTKTLWKLLERNGIPVFVFVNKMDQNKRSEQSILKELKEKLSDGCVNFSEKGVEFFEELALGEEQLLETYLEGQNPQIHDIQRLIRNRKVFPCYFGSALKDFGVQELLEGLDTYLERKTYGKEFAAKVYKIGRDTQGQRITYMKITGGSLSVKQMIEGRDRGGVLFPPEKADQLRFYNGISYENVNTAYPGEIVAVMGLEKTYAGQALGKETENSHGVLEPVLTYSILLPENTNLFVAYEKLKQLEEEEPNLQITRMEEEEFIRCKVMGEIQLQVLKELAETKLGVPIEFTSGEILYKETIENTVEGIGHFEPLRHYAEVHVLLEPLPEGSGIQIDTDCSEDLLDRNWQRLILSHIAEKEHRGVLTGAPITDIKITLLSGKAHNKHTEGGDFRQATYRAIRQGLRKANSRLLEPVYEFSLEIPNTMVGRAMSDLQRMCAEYRLEQLNSIGEEEVSLLKGKCPVVTMQEYQKEVMAYTKGQGKLECLPGGYDYCHNETVVLEMAGYSPERDQQNPCGSIFCSHGAGVYVEWDQVEERMHLPYAYKEQSKEEASREIKVSQRSEQEIVLGTEEIDAILERTFYSNRKKEGNKAVGWKYSKKSEIIPSGERIYKGQSAKEEYLLVDGYNIIFAWEELKELAEVNLDAARGKLQEILSDYAAMKGIQLMVVYDAYRLQGHRVEVLEEHNIKIVFTKEAETADQYIEKFAARHAKEYRITVATSDGLEQIIIRGQGCYLLSAGDLKEEISRKKTEFRESYMEKKENSKLYLKEIIFQDILENKESQ